MSDPALHLGATCLGLILLKLRSQFGLGNVDLSHQVLNAELHIIHSDLLFLGELRLIIFVVFTHFASEMLTSSATLSALSITFCKFLDLLLRSEGHTSALQSPCHLVFRFLSAKTK